MADSDEPDVLDDPELRALAATLRSEWHADYAELADEARMQWEHGRTLVDRIEEAMARGDRLHFVIGAASFSGLVRNVGTDWCSVETAGGIIDIRLALHRGEVGAPIVIRRVERGRTGGTRAPQPPMGFRARCYELEMEGHPVRVGTQGAEVVSGHLTVGADHLMITDPQGDTLLPLDWVSWISPAE